MPDNEVPDAVAAQRYRALRKTYGYRLLSRQVAPSLRRLIDAVVELSGFGLPTAEEVDAELDEK